MPEDIIREVVGIRFDGSERNASSRRSPGSYVGSEFLYSSVAVRARYGLGYEVYDVPGDRYGTREYIEESFIFRATEYLARVNSSVVVNCGSGWAHGYDVTIRVLNHGSAVFRNTGRYHAPGRYDRRACPVGIVGTLSIIPVGVSATAFPFVPYQRHFARIRRGGTTNLCVILRRISHPEADLGDRVLFQRDQYFRLAIREGDFSDTSGSVHRKPFFRRVVEKVSPRLDA